MQRNLVPELGEEFATISSGVCGISPFTAKLILYNTLDDGYGRYFHDIFSPEDREQPYLVRDIGSPIPRRLNGVSKKCVEMAQECISAHGLEIGEWRKTWKDVAMCGKVSKNLKRFAPGELGEMFVRYAGTGSSFVDSMVAKRALMDFVSCGRAEEKIFTESDRNSFIYSSLLGAEEWHPRDICSEQFFEQITEKASKFAASTLAMFDEGAPFVGVTFGWPTKDRKEWHVYGDLVSAGVFRCEVKDLPYLFGMVCYDAPRSTLESLYSNTYLCVVAVDAAKRSLPDKVENAFMYEFPVADIVSCKWVGTLTDIAGPYAKNKKSIVDGFLKVNEDGENNA